MRQGGVTGMAGDGEIQPVAGGHDGVVGDGNGAGRQTGPVVVAEDAFHRETVEQPVGDHAFGSAAAFLGWLENQLHGAGPVRVLR
ncbi:hypothetical protein GALL_496130 [mine drainage metagenome]|uniref:Uncharacterized protein n=1 Tax=mine drainage metagenome TaxID=410659 RepID=A0A1J5PDE7_9ZZZZ